MQWMTVDAALDYISTGRARKPSRKVLYAMVRDGLRVVRLGDSGRRMLFCTQWIDEYLTAKSRSTRTPTAVDGDGVTRRRA